MTDYYADLIGNITVTGHLVRIDFLSQASPAPHQPPQQQGTQFQVAHSRGAMMTDTVQVEVGK